MSSANLSDDPQLGKVYAATMRLHFSLRRRKQARPPVPHRQELEALVSANPASANRVADALEEMNAENYAVIIGALRSMSARAAAHKFLSDIEKTQ